LALKAKKIRGRPSGSPYPLNNLIMPKTILFIEDESALQKTFGEILSQEGYKVVSALDGELGLKLAKEKKPNLILLDLILPKVHGFEVLRDLKKDSETKDIPVIVLTNLEGIDDVEKALELGATTYLVKASYSLEEVVEKIKKALGD
jgi:DNA-binding response OmpR family regulator